MEIRLRALEPEDLSELYEIENDVALWQAGTTTAPISQYALRQYIATCKNDIFEDAQLRLVIEADRQFAGLLDLTDFSPMHRRAEVGIVVCPSYRQQGVATQALKLMTDYARRVIGLHQLYAIVSDVNIAAQKLFENAGYTSDHKLKDWLLLPNGNAIDAHLYQSFMGL